MAKWRGLYTSIGKTFASSGKVAEVEKLMGSLDEAYRLIPKNERSKLAFKNFGEAADSIRQSFVSEIFPELVSYENEKPSGIKYSKMVSLLVEGMKEQQTQIEDLKAEIKALKN